MTTRGEDTKPATTTSAAGTSSASGHDDQDSQVTLDGVRDAFFVAHRACERFSKVLGGIAQKLQDSKADDPWLTEAHEGAQQVLLFHQQQASQWSALAGSIDAYMESVRDLAERMAVDELKGVEGEEVDLSENKAKKVHPELRKFQLEKQARILGKVGGVPALGAMKLPVLPRDQVLRATGGTAAREIHYSKMEGRDAPQLATVFQRKAASSESTQAEWQQEAKAKVVRRHTEAAAEELQRAADQEEQLTKAGAGELAGALKLRQQALRSQEEEAQAAAASSYRRVEASGNTANADLPVRELQEASPELAAALRARQELSARTRRLLSDETDEAAAAAGSSSGQPPGWNNSAAPFGGELAALLRKRRESEELKAAPTKDSGPAAVPLVSDASSELAARLKLRAQKLSQEEGKQQE